MNKKAIEAAAKAAFNAAMAWAAEDDPTSFADGKIREVYTDMVRAAIDAYTSTLSPLRAREEIARYIANNSVTAGWQAYRLTDDILAILSRTAGQEWREPEGKRAAIIEQCAKIAETYDMDGAFKDDMLPRGWRGCRRQIAVAIRALLPAPPVAEPKE